MKPLGVGIVGCGSISGIYFQNLCQIFEQVSVKACADLDRSRAEAKAETFPGVKICSLDDMLADPEIDIIVNLTTPQGHYDVAMRSIQSGKHVYTEKPLTLTCDEGQRLRRAAAEAGVRIGNAPDTFLGAGIQTCRRLIDDGAIGTPIGAQAFMLCRGHERWHPDPAFYYQPGGGPLFDMGPYYLTALIALLGPVRRVTGSAGISFPERTITSEKRRGQIIKVEVPTHITAALDFASGAIASLTTSFDVWASCVPHIEIFGSEGTLHVPDPNGFKGPVRLKCPAADTWQEMPLTAPFSENSRGLGVAEMANAILNGHPHCASGDLAYHVLEIMHAVLNASEQGRHVEIDSPVERPAPLPSDFTLS